jgi:hypothetical protein
MVIDDLVRNARELHFVILRRKIKGGYIKGIVEVEHCGDRVKQIITSKMVQIICEAQIEPKLSRMELAKIDTSMEGPNSLLELMWKAGWIAVQGLNRKLLLEDKITVIEELLKVLQLNKYDGKELFTRDDISEGIKNTQISQELSMHVNIILVKMNEQVDVSWDKGYVILADGIVWTQQKVHFIEKLPDNIKHFSTRPNSQGLLSEIDPIIITLVRQDEVDEILSAKEDMVIGGMTKHNGSLSMAERKNLALIMYGCGYELDEVIDGVGNLKSIRNNVFIYISIIRVIGNKLKPEIVLLLLARDHSAMQRIRDNLLELKEVHNDRWFKIKKFGVSYFYVQSIGQALRMRDSPDVYSGIQNIAIYNIDDNYSAVEIVHLAGKVTGKKFINIQIEEQRNRRDELLLDDQKREKRAYLYLGDITIEITNEIIKGLSKILRRTQIVEQQILLAYKLPFWTSSHYYYITRTG